MPADRNQRPYYSITCEMGDYDFSANLMRVNILNGINNPYPTIMLTMIVDSKYMVRNDLFGIDDIELSIELMAEETTPTETLELTLMVVKQQIPLPIKGSDDLGNNEEQETLILTTVLKDPCLQMNKTINKIFDESKQATAITMVEDIAKEFLPDMSIDIKRGGENTERPYQFIVPPMSFISAIKYIDGSVPEIIEKYGPGIGLYNGPMFVTNRLEEGGTSKFCLWNLNKILDEQPVYIVHQLGLGTDSEVFEDAGRTSDKFYTYSEIKSVYRGNQDIIANGYEKKFLSKPIDSLCEWIDVSAEDVIKSNAVSTGDLLINENLREEIKYHTIGEVGLEYSDSPYRARYSRKLSTSSEIEFHLDRNLALLHLSKVGVPIEIVPESLDYTELGGKYIASGSKISLTREVDSWVARVSIRAFRGNLK